MLAIYRWNEELLEYMVEYELVGLLVFRKNGNIEPGVVYAGISVHDDLWVRVV